MSGYAELRELGITFRPPSRPLPPGVGAPSPFSASWSSTVELLAHELGLLVAERIVVELALGEGDLRVDGLPRANARLSGDGVRVSFESRYGPLMYETARFTGAYYRRNLDGWQVNLRAIALGLEALRKVDRYGITKRGEQYTGWKQLAASTDPADAIVTGEQALAVLYQAAGHIGPDGGVEIAADELARRAVRRSHPDVPGGSDEQFRKVQRAREVLGV